MTIFETGDQIGLIGDQAEIEAVEKLYSDSESKVYQIGVAWET
jgi:hypothetical protein